MNRKAFTLIELAMVIIIIGLLLGIGITAFSILIKRSKISETKEIINAATEAVLGYTYSAKKLPDAVHFSQIIRQKKDAFGKDVVYIYDRGLTAYCGRLKTNITVEVCPDVICSTPTQTVHNVAFIILSGSANYNNQTAGSGEITADTTIRVYEFGVNVDNYPGDMNRVEPYDDIVKWITLAELHNNKSCEPLHIENTVLPDGIEDTPYNGKIDVKGGVPPYTFGTWNGTSCDTGTRWSGSGLSLTSDGHITGTVNFDTDSGPGSITDCSGEITITNVCVQDSLGDSIPLPPLKIKVLPQKVTILTDMLPPAYEGSDYNVSFGVMGGGDSYTWNIEPPSDELPDDLTFSNGEITGSVASDAGCSNPSPYSFTVYVSSCGMTAVKGFSLTLIDPDCNTGGGSSGGGSTCPSLSVYNTGSKRYVRTGYISLGCIETSPCNEYNTGQSISLSNGDCAVVYERRLRNGRCRSQERIFDYSLGLSFDSNSNCQINYNNGVLLDR